MIFGTKISQFLDGLFSLVINFAKVLLALMVIIVFLNVILRYGFGSGIVWSEEISLIIVIWFTFFAMALGVKEQLHININILPKSLPSKFHLSLYLFKQVTQLIISVLMVYYGILLTINGAKSFLPVTGLSNAITYLPVPISGFFIIIFSVVSILNMKNQKNEIIKKENGHA